MHAKAIGHLHNYLIKIETCQGINSTPSATRPGLGPEFIEHAISEKQTRATSNWAAHRPSSRAYI